jgi:phosphotransferase system enzyme I (PtsI)
VKSRLNCPLPKGPGQDQKEIQAIQTQIASNLSKEMSDIFTSHLMVLEDPKIDDQARKKIREEKRNIEWIINDISLDLINSLSGIKDEYIRERIIDLSDISKRLIANLQRTSNAPLSDIKEEVIVFATDLTPSETAQMNKNLILAFVTDKGGKTSHTSIMARALEIPAIVGTLNTTSMVKNDDMVIVDAIKGKIIINPTKEEIDECRRAQKEFNKMEKELSKLSSLPAKTLDSEDIFIYGNIEIPEEKKLIKEHMAQGIGRFRSEFLFLNRSLPDEETQLKEYRRVAEFFNPLPVTIRTIDVGGDKIYAYTNESKERNPFLGCRAIRFSLENLDLFKIQIRAILRASHYGNVKMMFPMITTVEEFRKARTFAEETMKELDREGVPYNKDIEIGLMIEVPSAIVNADLLVKYADFFSIGTNDLVQYILAVDRISEKIAYLYNPLNIAVLRMLDSIIKTSRKYDMPLSICGEMAGEPQYTMVLLGLGFRHLSMGPTSMQQVKKIVRSVTIAECEAMIKHILTLEDTHEIEEIARKTFKEKFHEISV